MAGPAGAHSGTTLAANIARADRKTRFQMLGLTLPALLIVIFFLGIPLAILAGFSVYENGVFTLRHYGRMISDSSYSRSLVLTLEISLLVTVLTAVIGYPVAYLLSQLKTRMAMVCLTLVLIPFWTSLLVRTYAWLVLLQRQGVVNKALTGSGLISEPLHLVHNVTGTVIGMLHIMLPFLILPLYANMRRIDLSLMLAARSLGATPLYTFWRVYFPLSLPGLTAGVLLVFILSMGFYITPAILGGGRTIMLSMLIERNVNLFFEWGAASAVAIVFLLAVLAIFALLGRFLRIDQLVGH